MLVNLLQSGEAEGRLHITSNITTRLLRSKRNYVFANVALITSALTPTGISYPVNIGRYNLSVEVTSHISYIVYISDCDISMFMSECYFSGVDTWNKCKYSTAFISALRCRILMTRLTFVPPIVYVICLTWLPAQLSFWWI